MQESARVVFLVERPPELRVPNGCYAVRVFGTSKRANDGCRTLGVVAPSNEQGIRFVPARWLNHI